MDKKIRDICHVSFDIESVPNEDKVPMHEWYEKLLDKTYDELSMFDVTRMIIQKVFIELAISKALEFVNENPFCGQRYEGELIELLSKMDVIYFSLYKAQIREILLKAMTQNEAYEWLCEEERDDFFDLVEGFYKKIEIEDDGE